MTKLSGTSGQLFSGLAESLNMRGASRSAKATGTKSQADSFNDLLHTVSNLAKRALNDEGSDTSVKTGTLRARLAHRAGKDETGQERTEVSDEAGPSHKSGQKTDHASETQGPVDDAAKADASSGSSMPTIVGQELAAVPAVKSQVQSQADGGRDASARDERSSTSKREVQAAGMAKIATADSAPTPAAPIGARSPEAAAAQQDNEDASKALPATSGFEAVTANVERAVKASARDALPEAIKVTVVQQETHLPPAQFNAPQQVANAVVAELKESTAPSASSAAPDLAGSQTNAPDQPLKILTVNLEPPALGNVTVRLRLVGSEVSIHLAAERKDTSQMLDQQRDSIRDLMQSAGYVADVAPVQHGSLDGFQGGSGQSQSQPQPQVSGQQQSSSQSQGTFDGAGTSSGQSDGGARQTRQERQSNQETRHDQDVAPQIRRGPVYL
ncbi:flagellar hook-length control protein FliK [Bradyrhizobium sacchari]|uniref:Chemotaxis protein MotD n=1 Tax=Bradyrhizobium sacchari TaxID=1399419 RepID=A0A560JSE3_9BRAD|nr:flagellar hook-length control protein FliK [Bradyrhizobium sacchari]OPZ00074.1 flagellar hook-length control protein FliK [Bradyrhizobium sacchari]TWB60159.1 chemotaxis protein MotD [Bradyrhizobium sacchari]TWB74031.1 chemotaxis protein MotD [Bradyrhizobium sacchari]